MDGEPDGDADAARRRRGTQLMMLVFALAVVACGWAAAGAGLKGTSRGGIAAGMMTPVAIAAGTHLAVRGMAPYADPLLLPLAVVLDGLGVVMTYRLQQAGRNGNPGTMFVPLSTGAVTQQLIFTLAGAGCFAAILAVVREPRMLQRYTYLLGTAGLILLALPAVLPPSISEVPGTTAKIQIALAGLTVQPAELAKIALAISFAGYLVAKRDVLSLAGRRVLGIDLPSEPGIIGAVPIHEAAVGRRKRLRLIRRAWPLRSSSTNVQAQLARPHTRSPAARTSRSAPARDPRPAARRAGLAR